MMDKEWFQPHNSEITGAMVQNCWRYYGIPPHHMLTVIAAETSFGDPDLGGRLISEGHHNYGCLKFGIHPKCDDLAVGFVTVAGKDWYSFPSMQNGMMALGRYLKVGPLSKPGYYLECLKRNDWRAFAEVFYGKVPGLEEYVSRLEAIDAKLVARANECGWVW